MTPEKFREMLRKAGYVVCRTDQQPFRRYDQQAVDGLLVGFAASAEAGPPAGLPANDPVAVVWEPFRFALMRHREQPSKSALDDAEVLLRQIDGRLSLKSFDSMTWIDAPSAWRRLPFAELERQVTELLRTWFPQAVMA